MDEMNNMNETTVEEKETSVEVVPEENVQVNESNSEDIPMGKILGGVALGAAVVYGMYKHHKNKKTNSDEKKPKTKKKVHLRMPFVITEEVETLEEKKSDEHVEETSDEE